MPRGKRVRAEEQAIAALLECGTIAEAAERIKVDVRTMKRWLAEPTFRARLRDARRGLLEHSLGRLQRLAGAAISALERNLDAATPSAQISAANSVLNHVVKATEILDLAEHVAELDQLIRNRTGPVEPLQSILGLATVEELLELREKLSVIEARRAPDDGPAAEPAA